jgi:hypothetical protein
LLKPLRALVTVYLPWEFDLLLRSPKEAFKVVLCPQSAGTKERGD